MGKILEQALRGECSQTAGLGLHDQPRRDQRPHQVLVEHDTKFYLPSYDDLPAQNTKNARGWCSSPQLNRDPVVLRVLVSFHDDRRMRRGDGDHGELPGNRRISYRLKVVETRGGEGRELLSRTGESVSGPSEHSPDEEGSLYHPLIEEEGLPPVQKGRVYRLAPVERCPPETG